MNASADRLDPELHARILAEKVIPESGLNEFSSHEKPKAIILAGQPGAGKGRLADAAQTELSYDAVKIDPDELREHHPDVKTFRQVHPYTWSGDTHPDASRWADELLKETVAGKKNLIFDTTLSNGQWASDELIKGLQAQGYEVEVRAVASPKLESELGVDKRFSDKLNVDGFGRHVPAAARDAIYDKLPTSLDTIHAQTDVPIRIFNREGVELYDSRTTPRSPGAALEEARQARLKDPAITHQLRDGYREQLNWHHDLPQTLPNNTKVDPLTAENLLAQRSANRVVDSVEHAAREAVEVDHVTRIRPTRIRAGSALGIAGLALDALDAADTVRTSQRLRGEGNATAADSALIHFGTRTVGGFAGAGLGMTVGAAAGVETGPGLLLTGAIGGIAGALGGDKIAEWTDNRRIYNQQDRQGHTWTYDPDHPTLGWQRRAPIDASDDHINNPAPGTLRAPPALANELNYQSTNTSVELVLGSPPRQRDPFAQPAASGDTPSIAPASWVRDAQSHQWRREAILAFEHGMPLKHIEVAAPERAMTLDRAAAQTVLQNAANSPAAIAARYQDAYARNGWAAHGPMPEAVRHARTDLDTLVASDDNRYQRRANGDWVSDGLIYNSTATGNLREALEATREVVRATLPSPPAVQTPPPMTPDAVLRDQVMGAYANAGVVPDTARVEASATAVRATWTAQGLDPATTALQLQRGANGRYDQDSPIASLRLGVDGKTYVIAATTTTEEIQRVRTPPQDTVPRPSPAISQPSHDTHAPAHPGRDPHAATAPVKTQSDLILDQFLAAMEAGDEQAMSAASHAMAESDWGQQFIQEAKEEELTHLQQTPGRDHPLFTQAVQHLERLGPDVAGYWDRVELERMAGTIAYEAKRQRMPAIDDIVPIRDGQGLMATWTHPTHAVFSTFATVDSKVQAAAQPLDQSLQQLAGETQRQEQQQLAWAQAREQQPSPGRSL